MYIKLKATVRLGFRVKTSMVLKLRILNYKLEQRFQNFFSPFQQASSRKAQDKIVIGSIVQGMNASRGLIKSTFVLTLLVLKLTYLQQSGFLKSRDFFFFFFKLHCIKAKSAKIQRQQNEEYLKTEIWPDRARWPNKWATLHVPITRDMLTQNIGNK